MTGSVRRLRPLILKAILGFILPLATFAMPAHADEVITSFHSDIDLAKSGRMTVVETINVRSEGYQIKHGIYRIFPLTFTGDDGEMHRVDFDIISIDRDGHSEPYRTQTVDNGIIIYIGDKDVFLDDGDHTYKIAYETGRQVRYFPKHDELFWNVTGNQWKFAIRSASATVKLPSDVTPEATVFYTGIAGSTQHKATSSTTGSIVNFETTFPLNIEEGLTVGIKFAKGAIDAPSDKDLRWWAIHDRMNSIVAGICLLVVFAYFFLQWLRVGRDPSRGVIVPRWDPPEGLSPALVNYVAYKGFSNSGWTAFSASAINLAVKGLITLDDLSKSVTMKGTDKSPDEKLPLGEDKIYSSVKGYSSFAIAKSNGTRVQQLGDSFRNAIEKEHRGKYHRYNAGVITLGILLTIIAYIAVIFFCDFKEDMMGLMVVPAVVFVFVAIFSAVLAATALSAPVIVLRVIAWIFLSFFWLAFAIVIIVSAWAAHDAARSQDDWLAFIASGLMILVATFFTTIMGAATPLGRKLRDGIEGLKLYLTVAEKNRMNLAGAPAMSPQHYEKLLPYAVALGVEKPWSEHFQTWLDAAGAAAAADYQPMWYSGRDFDSRHFGDRMSTFSSSLSSTVSSSLPDPPKSSSSGFSSSSGGGSSGGGGGGGGGGGW